MEATGTDAFEGWAILELMGHRRLGGYVRQVEMYGTALCRVDVPGDDANTAATQFYSAAAIYCLTPTTEETARRVAAGFRPEPVSQWQLPSPKPDRAGTSGGRILQGYDGSPADGDDF